jgi:hypothetical protein
MSKVGDTQQPRPASKSEAQSIVGVLAGSVLGFGDLISPIDESWEADE